MKYYIIGYAACNKDFWTGIAFWNNSKEETTVHVQIRRFYNGTVSNEFDVSIGPQLPGRVGPSQILHELNDPNGRAAIFITCSDNVLITPTCNWGLPVVTEVDGFI